MTVNTKPFLHYAHLPGMLYTIRVRNNMRPPAIFRAFQQDDRPTSYSQGHDGRTIRRQSITSVRYAIAYRKSWVWSTDIDARALALRARVRAHDHTIAIIMHALCTCCMHCTLSRAFRPRCLSSSLSLSLST